MASTRPRYRGLFPVVPTTFTESGELDLASQKRCVDFMIDAGSNGLCILANFSEQFALSDQEREVLTSTILDHVAGRVPVIVTTTHFGTAVCAERIPTGLAQVEGTPFDFRRGPRIGERIREPHEQLQRGKGYAHNFAIDTAPPAAGLLRPVARLADPASGRRMDIHSTEPGLQFYSGNFLDATLQGSHGAVLRHGDGLCLETQHFPDAPNRPEFESTRLAAGETFKSSTVMRFGTFAVHEDPFEQAAHAEEIKR